MMVGVLSVSQSKGNSSSRRPSTDPHFHSQRVPLERRQLGKKQSLCMNPDEKIG